MRIIFGLLALLMVFAVLFAITDVMCEQPRAPEYREVAAERMEIIIISSDMVFRSRVAVEIEDGTVSLTDNYVLHNSDTQKDAVPTDIWCLEVAAILMEPYLTANRTRDIDSPLSDHAALTGRRSQGTGMIQRRLLPSRT